QEFVLARDLSEDRETRLIEFRRYPNERFEIEVLILLEDALGDLEVHEPWDLSFIALEFQRRMEEVARIHEHILAVVLVTTERAEPDGTDAWRFAFGHRL